MIFTFTDLDKGFDEIFHNRMIDIWQWESKIPSPTINEALLWDPQLLHELYNNNTGPSLIANRYLYSTVTATRVVIAKIASTLGVLQPEFNTISNIYRESPDSISLVLKTADAILNSEYFQRGMDAIGAIPIVGWIIKIVVKIAESIYKLVRYVQDKNAKEVTEFLAKQPAIPLANFNHDADESVAQNAMKNIMEYNMNYIFTPRYIWKSHEDFIAMSEKSPDNGKNPLTAAFNVSSNLSGGGLGAIPGTINLMGALRFPTGGCAGMSDTGEFYPTARNLATSLFQVIQKPGPALYSLNTSYLTTLWKDNIYALLEYAEESIKKGWTCKSTGVIDTNTFLCALEILGSYDGCKNKTDVKLKNKVEIKGTGHYTAFREYLFNQFYNGIPATKNKGKYGLNDIDIEAAIPIKALKNIKETQYATINSLTCAYINDELSPINNYRFEGLAKDPVLKKKWKENLTILLNQSEDWKKIYFWDVPDGEFKNDLYQKSIKNKLNPDKAGPIDSTISKKLATKSVLGDPSPPSPFAPVDILAKRGMGKTTTSGSKSNSGLFLGLAGLAGIGLLMRK